jgi:hypothetical protein
MRPRALNDGHRPLQKVILGLFGAVTGGQAPGPMRVLSYHRDLCGKYLAACFQEGMRGSHEWTKAELELFAAFVSRLNECRY